LPEINADGCNGCLRQRSVTEVEEIFKTKKYVREAQVPCNIDYPPENNDLRAKNTYFWNDNP